MAWHVTVKTIRITVRSYGYEIGYKCTTPKLIKVFMPQQVRQIHLSLRDLIIRQMKSKASYSVFLLVTITTPLILICHTYITIRGFWERDNPFVSQ